MRLVLLFLLIGSCLGISQLEKNVIDAMKGAETMILTVSKKIKTMPDDNKHAQSQRANKDSQIKGQRGDWLAETTKLMVKRYGLGILPDLEKIDVNRLMPNSTRTKRQSTMSCPADDTNCSSSTNRNFRTVTGICNNRLNKDYGKSVTPIRRLLNQANYEDGFSSYRTKSVTGVLLPSARAISNRLHGESTPPVFDFTRNHFFQQFGQWIAHDIIFTPSAAGSNGQTIDCSSCDSEQDTDHCAPIRVPADDSYFPPNSCIRLTRSLNGQEGLGQRVQINQNTHFLDLSQVYGSEICEAASLRSFRNGELLELRLGEVTLPPQAPNDTNCQSTDPNFCFLAGDFRNSLHPSLIPLHSTYVKLHNFIARSINQLRTRWSDESIFQETRRMTIAIYQHHVYSEYLPMLLGVKTMFEFGLLPRGSLWNGYNESVNPSLTAEFLSSFRFGHSQVRQDVPRMTNGGTPTGPIPLGSNIFYTDSVYERNNSVEEMLDGMIQSPAMAIDKEFSFPIRNQMFEIRGQKASGVDLVATNIMRTRDAGLFPYNVYREVAGLRKAKNFEDLAGEMDQANINALKAVYAHVDDIDFYSGMLMERPANGSMLGRTATFLLADGFRNLKYGDRFFYEWQVPESRALSPDQLAKVQSISLAKVMCSMSNQMERVNKDIFNSARPRDQCDRLVLNDVATLFAFSHPMIQNKCVFYEHNIDFLTREGAHFLGWLPRRSECLPLMFKSVFTSKEAFYCVGGGLLQEF